MIDDKDDWFEAIDEVEFTQKHKIYNWIKEVVDDNKSRYNKSLSKESWRSSNTVITSDNIVQFLQDCKISRINGRHFFLR